MRFAAALMALAPLSVVMVACTAPPATPPRAAPALRGPRLVGTVATEGGASIHTSFSIPVALSLQAAAVALPSLLTCGAYATGPPPDVPGSHGRAFAAPVVQTRGEQQLYLRVVLADGYAGPGTYTQQTSPQLAGIADVAIVSAGGGEVTQTYRSTDASVTDLTVRADGSGWLTFSAWATNEVRAGNVAGHIGGELTWSCT